VATSKCCLPVGKRKRFFELWYLLLSSESSALSARWRWNVSLICGFSFSQLIPSSRRPGVCHFVIDSDFVIMAGADVPQARDYTDKNLGSLLWHLFMI